MSYRPDVVVVGSNGEVVGFVEVKNKPDLSSDLAEAFRSAAEQRTARVHEYFVLMSQEKAFVWKQKDKAPVEIPVSEALARYWPRLASGDRLRGTELEYLVIQWLRDMTTREGSPSNQVERKLTEVGLLDRIRGAEVKASDTP